MKTLLLIIAKEKKKRKFRRPSGAVRPPFPIQKYLHFDESLSLSFLPDRHMSAVTKSNEQIYSAVFI